MIWRISVLVLFLLMQIELVAIVYGANRANQSLFWLAMPKPPPTMYRDAPPLDAWMDI